MQEPLVQHQRPVPGIQDHTLDIIVSKRHAEQLLHISEKSGHYAAASLLFFLKSGEGRPPFFPIGGLHRLQAHGSSGGLCHRFLHIC